MTTEMLDKLQKISDKIKEMENEWDADENNYIKLRLDGFGSIDIDKFINHYRKEIQ